MTLDQKIGICGVIATLIVGVMAWLIKPEWVHILLRRFIWQPIRSLVFPKSRRKTGLANPAFAQSENGLRVKATMELRSEERKEIWLAVNVVNLGSKIAFIKRVAIMIPTVPFGGLTPVASEMVIHQETIIEIKPDGGCFTWKMRLRQNMGYAVEEIEGEKYGKSYVEFTSEERVVFRYLPLPDSAWISLNYIAPVFDGKIAHRCSHCDEKFLIEAGAKSMKCPFCGQLDILNAPPQQSEAGKQNESSKPQVEETLPFSIRELIQEVVNNQIRQYHQSKRDALRQLTAELSRKGILGSNASIEGEMKIYLCEFEGCAQRILASIKKIDFVPFPDCEKELITICTIELRRLIFTEPLQFSELSKRFAVPVYRSRVEHALRQLETDLKIRVHQLRTKSPVAPTQSVIVVSNKNNVQAGEGNISAQMQARPERPHWTVGPMFWLTVGIFVAAAIVAVPVVSDWTHSKPRNFAGEDDIPKPSDDEKGKTFSLSINDTIIPEDTNDLDTNDMVSIDVKRMPYIVTGRNRAALLKIRNLKNFELDQLSVIVDMPLRGTNVAFVPPWQGPVFQFSNSDGIWNGWRVKLDFPSTAYSTYTPPAFYLNTSGNLVPIRVEVNALGRHVQRYFAFLK